MRRNLTQVMVPRVRNLRSDPTGLATMRGGVLATRHQHQVLLDQVALATVEPGSLGHLVEHPGPFACRVIFGHRWPMAVAALANHRLAPPVQLVERDLPTLGVRRRRDRRSDPTCGRDHEYQECGSQSSIPTMPRTANFSASLIPKPAVTANHKFDAGAQLTAGPAER